MKLNLDELEQLAAQATPGPWEVVVSDKYGFTVAILPPDFPQSPLVGRAKDEQDAAYIVASCNAVPDLIAENRALQERVRELERMVDIMAEDMGDSSHAGGYYRVCRGCKDADDFGMGGCGKDCLKTLYEQAAKEAGE